MEQLASPFVEKLLDYTVNAIGRQLGYLIFYHKNIEVLKNQVEVLKDQQATVQHSINEATRNGEIIEDIVKGWMSRVDEMTRQAEQFYEEESQSRTECSKTSCPNLWSRYRLSKRAKKMRLEVVEIQEQQNFNGVSYRDSPKWILDSTNDNTNEGIDSRVPIMNQIMEALRDSNVNMIGLCGLGGVGKTTIAKEVAKKVKEEQMFEKVIMAVVSNDLNLESIQFQIAEMLGMKLEEKTKSIRASRLNARLKQERNLLIILDDLWETLDLSKLGIPYIDDGKHNRRDGSCKILLTSRDEKLLSDQMKCERNIKVGLLSDKEAWELFKRVADFSTDSNSPDLIGVANEIVQKCQGLPLAIDAIARALRNKGRNEWNDALKRLKNPLRRNITGIRHVDSILKFSYDHLSSEHQPIFVLSAMLSHDPSVNDLLMYSVGLDLLRVQNMEEAQCGISTFISKLKASSLLLDSFSNNHFTMHDVIRDVALSIASNEKHFFVGRHTKLSEWPNEDSVESYIGICLERSEISDLPKELHGPTLEFFLLNSIDPGLNIPTTFFKSTKLLKVLGFKKLNFSSLPSLSHLGKLKTLCLHSCLLEDITEVGNLKNLKILSLAYSKIEQLPFELAQLTCLQMLNLAHCSRLSVIPPKLLSSLKRLEVLCMENSFDQWKAEGSCECNDNASLGELKNLPISSLDIHIPDASVLPKDLFLVSVLERYRIFIGKHWGWLGYYETLKTLKLELGSCIHLEFAVQKLLEKVEDLYLGGSNGLTNVFYNLDGRGFPHLKHLHIEQNDDIEYVVLTSTHLKVAFPVLETLELRMLKGLKKLCQGPIVATFFQNLKVIKVRSCDQLKNIFPISMVRLFSQLVEIEIYNCKSMEEIVIRALVDSFDEQDSALNDIIFRQLCSLHMRNLIALNDFYAEKRATNNEGNKIVKSLFNNKVSFPKLETLELFDLNKLITSIWDDQLPQRSFSNLKMLTVRSCGFVKLVPLHVLKSLNNLVELEVENCDMLEVVFDFEELNSSKEVLSSVVVPLKKLSLEWLPKLKHVWSNNPQGIVSFQSLQLLKVSNCASLESMFPASIAKGCMLHLEELQISYCGIAVIVAKDEVLESVAPTFMFPSLISLQLFRLPNLKNFHPHSHTSKWPRLQQISIVECEELEIFENKASSSSAIQEDRTLDLKYPLFSHEQVIPNLEQLGLGGKQAEMLWSGQFATYHFHKVKWLCLEDYDAETFPFGLLKRFPNLEKLELKFLSMEIFSCMEPLEEATTFPFRELHLSNWEEAKHIWNEHSPPQILQCLENLEVKYCDDLISLGPSFISLANLTHLKVSGCEGLTNLLTSSTATSLVHLSRLTIHGCKQIEEIIAKPQGEDDGEKEIIFSKLGHLELYNLQRLKSFCSHNYIFKLPLLDQVIVKECPRFKMFCPGDIHGPLLKSVEVADDHNFWDTNLNYTIQQRFTIKEVISTFETLVLDMKDVTMIMNDQFLLDDFTQVQTLYLESFVDDCVTFPYSILQRFPNLYELHVEHSSFEEILPSHAHTDYHMGKHAPFARLHLAHLDHLKNIWKDDSQLQPIHQNLKFLRVECCCSLIKLAPSTTSFENLRKLKVSRCHQLLYLVTNSIAKTLVNLYTLEIIDCKMMEEIVTNETNEDAACGVTFGSLTSLELANLPSLKRFCFQSHTFKFPELFTIIITGCLQMKMFYPGVLETPKLSVVKIEEDYVDWNEQGDLNQTIELLFSSKDGRNI